MSRGAKGRIAIVVLFLLIVGSGVGIAWSEPARVRFWAWRATAAADPAVRKNARLELLAIGRPAIDPVLVGVYVREVRERSKPGTRVATVWRAPIVGHWDDRDIIVQYHDDGVDVISALMLRPDPVATAFERLGGSRRVVLLEQRTGWRDVVVSCPLDEATEARLHAEFPELK